MPKWYKFIIILLLPFSFTHISPSTEKKATLQESSKFKQLANDVIYSIKFFAGTCALYVGVQIIKAGFSNPSSILEDLREHLKKQNLEATDEILLSEIRRKNNIFKIGGALTAIAGAWCAIDAGKKLQKNKDRKQKHPKKIKIIEEQV